MSEKDHVAHYDASYENFASDLFLEIRSEVFGEDIGQNGWLTAAEQDIFITWLELNQSSTFLDVACGSGGPTLRIIRSTGCQGYGIDVHQEGIEAAKEQARERGLANRARFEQMDASQPLPYADSTFDGLICIDAINHLPDRAKIFTEWARVLKPGGRLVFSDPITVTGPLTNEEIRIRSSIGFFLFVPVGTDERLLSDAGFKVKTVEDRTENMAQMADRWLVARQARAADLRKVEGDKTFEGQQTFFQVATKLARERRLSRFAFQATRQ
jgi:ubiquinone/menaquinone biosynthesis C-methylase UbiE